MVEKSGASITCKNCNSVNIDKYCSNCGQKADIERYTVRRFFSMIFDAFNVQKGVLYTFNMLLQRPGKAINDYLGGRTKPYFNPFNYLLIAAGIYAVLVLWFDIFDTSVEATNDFLNMEAVQNSDEALAFQQKFITSFKGYINLIPLLMIPFASLISRLFYRSEKLFYGEHLVINSFLFAQGFFFTLLLTPLVLIFPALKAFYGPILAVVLIVYLIFALNRIFSGSIFRHIAGGLLVYIAGMLLFYLLFTILLVLIIIIISLLGISLTDLL